MAMTKIIRLIRTEVLAADGVDILWLLGYTLIWCCLLAVVEVVIDL